MLNKHKQNLIEKLNSPQPIDFDDYTYESVVLGLVGVGEHAPLNKYARDMGVSPEEYYLEVERGEYLMIDECGKICNHDLDGYYRRRFFNYNMSYIFDSCKLGMNLSEEDLLMPFPDELTFYISGVLPLFIEALKTEVKESVELFSPLMRSYKTATDAFLSGIMSKAIKVGDDVSGYFAGGAQPTPYAERLIERSGNILILKSDDCNGLDYKLALLANFRWYYFGHESLYLSKLAKFSENRGIK